MPEPTAAAPAQETPKAGDTANTTSTPAPKPAEGTPATTPAAPADGKAAPAPAAGDKTKVDAAPVTETKVPPETKPVVPEKYDFKLPENSQLDAKAVEDIAAYAKAQGLSNAQAQAQLERENAAIATFVEEQKTELKTKSQAWISEIERDKELGGDAFKQNIEMAHRVAKRFGSESFNKTLIETGLGNNPELVRAFARIGKVMSEDQLVIPGSQPTPSKSKKSAADTLYPTTADKTDSAATTQTQGE